MNEINLYRRMYATVVGQADEILQELAVTLTNPDCGRKELMEFGEKLKKALRDAEEIYISDVLPHFPEELEFIPGLD